MSQMKRKFELQRDGEFNAKQENVESALALRCLGLFKVDFVVFENREN